MFNSSLISISQEISNGRFNYRCPIIEAVNQTYTDIIHDAIAEWRMLEPSDEGFEEYFEDAFPPGFISRDRARAKQIIYDLRDIAEGEAIRFELAPIYAYVMYNLINNWCEMLDCSNQLKSNFPITIKNYLREKAISPRSDIYRSIKRWFTSPNGMLYDFGDTYNEDYMHADFAELVASIYLDDEYAQEKLGYLRVEIDEFFDLLPNDLYNRVMEKYKIDQESKKRKENNQVQKTEEKESLKEPDLKKEIIYSCLKLSDAPTITRGLEEDGLNRLLRDYLESSLKTYHYCVQDQTQRGYSATGDKAGELDLRIIDKQGFPEAICECLIHKNEKYLHDHIYKTVKNYNQIGCRNIYIVCYSRNKDYKHFWDSFKKWVDNCDLVKGWEEDEELRYGGVRYAIGVFDCIGDVGIIHFIGINMHDREGNISQM